MFSSLWKQWTKRRTIRRGTVRPILGSTGEALEVRRVLSADPLPVLLVIADRQDFYYQEYNDTRIGLEQSGVAFQVAATTTNPSAPHPGTGQGTSSGIVTPNIALANVNPDNYSAIAFVGGWGASMYQYAFPGDYQNNAYDGSPATKTVVNNLINEFLADDKPVAAICHGVTVLAWARVDGVSPLAGKQVSAPFIGSPAVFYNNQSYGHYQLMQAPQVTANGGIPNQVSGQYGNPNTVADDVVVDGRIITAENYDSALEFGRTLAREVRALVPPANQAPVITTAGFALAENSPAGTVVGQVSISDPDAGQTHSFQITGGSGAGLFAIDPNTGTITVAPGAILDFETTPQLTLNIVATDSGSPALADTELLSISLSDLVEVPTTPVGWFGTNLLVQGTAAADTIYLWSSGSGRASVWMNGVAYGTFTLPANGRVEVWAGAGNDQVYATDAWFPVSIRGDEGNDQMTGGWADDLLEGGAGVDRIWGQAGNDIILGGDGDDFLDGREGDDIVVGGAGNDALSGLSGRDVLIGGLGSDRIDGGTDDDLLIGGTTSFDTNLAGLQSILATWRQPLSAADRVAQLAAGGGGVSLLKGTSVFDDGELDMLNGSSGADALFAFASDWQSNLAPWDVAV